MTKLDGRARRHNTGWPWPTLWLPVHFIGVGEGLDDMAPFTDGILPRQSQELPVMDQTTPHLGSSSRAAGIGPLVIFSSPTQVQSVSSRPARSWLAIVAAMDRVLRGAAPVPMLALSPAACQCVRRGRWRACALSFSVFFCPVRPPISTVFAAVPRRRLLFRAPPAAPVAPRFPLPAAPGGPASPPRAWPPRSFSPLRWPAPACLPSLWPAPGPPLRFWVAFRRLACSPALAAGFCPRPPPPRSPLGPPPPRSPSAVGVLPPRREAEAASDKG